jgi:hypothetical protein
MAGRYGLLKVKVKRWRRKAVDREEWVSVINEANAFRRP